MSSLPRIARSPLLSLSVTALAAAAACSSPTNEDADSSGSTVQASCNTLDADSQGFEGGVGAWTPWYSTTVARSTAAAEAGSASLLVGVTGRSGWGIIMNDWPGLAVSPGPATISFWAKRAAGTDAIDPSLVVHWRDASGADLRVDSVKLAPLKSTWRQASLSTTAPPGTTHVGVELTGAKGSPGDAFYVDQVFVGVGSCSDADAGTPPPPTDAGVSSDGATATDSAPSTDSGGGVVDSGAPDATKTYAWSSTSPMASWSNGGYILNNDMWNCPNTPACGTQLIEANTYKDWAVVSTQPAGNTAVYTYPDVQTLTGDTPLSNYSAITSDFTESMPQASTGMIGEAAYDIWLNKWANEVMIWVDNQGQTIYDQQVGTATIGGQAFTVYRNGSELIVALNGNETSGHVDILATLKWLQSNSLLPATSTLTAVDFGWEICSTGGKAQTFTISNYALTTTP